MQYCLDLESLTHAKMSQEAFRAKIENVWDALDGKRVLYCEVRKCGCAARLYDVECIVVCVAIRESSGLVNRKYVV